MSTEQWNRTYANRRIRELEDRIRAMTEEIAVVRDKISGYPESSGLSPRKINRWLDDIESAWPKEKNP